MKISRQDAKIVKIAKVLPPLPVRRERAGVRVISNVERSSSNPNHRHPNPLPGYRERGPNPRSHWRPWRLGGLGVFCLSLTLFETACNANGDKPATPLATTTAPAAPTVQTFEDKKLGIRFQYPAGWQKIAGGTAVFAVAPPAGTVKGSASLDLDVPKLPMHIPGLLPIGQVTSGYIDDLKKKMKDLKVEENTYLQVKGANAHRTRCTGKVDGKVSTDFALVAVQGDRVYILSADSDVDGAPVAKQAFDAAVSSVDWVK